MNPRIKTAIATVVIILFGSIVGLAINLSSTILSQFGLTEAFVIAVFAAIPISLLLDWIIGDFKLMRDRASFFLIYFIVFFMLMAILYGLFSLGNPLAELIPW